MVTEPVHESDAMVEGDPASTGTADETPPFAGSKAAKVGLAGAHWQECHEDIVAKLPHGTTVAVNVANDRYVTGRNGLEAMDEFERRFGTHAVAWVFEVGVPITLGGFAWPRSSGE